MTEAAREFVTPLTLSTLSGNQVIVGMFPDPSAGPVNAGTWHIELGQWGEIMLIAPATANVLAKLAHGYADNAVTTLALAVRCPIVVSPAMDLDMWQHQTTQQNVATLKEMGYIVLPPEEGELASGLTGPGRLPEIDVLLKELDRVLDKSYRDLRGKKIVVTAGPTHEVIDPVRYIGNRSSGKMGFALATAAAQRGAQVTLISGTVSLQTPRHVKRINVESAEQMFHAVTKHTTHTDCLIMAAAVADFAPSHPSSKKIKKESLGESGFALELKRTKDILYHLAQQKNDFITVGFALETDNGLRNAKQKLEEKHLDFVVLNNPLEEGAGFSVDTNIVTIISKKGTVKRLKKMAKIDVAHAILDSIQPSLS
jgi:phosphopantothenoylcysteine decarboxylase/phosphopantothenate--cysteine ligase